MSFNVNNIINRLIENNEKIIEKNKIESKQNSDKIKEQ